ncbi:ComEC/Rec2 family competence protein [Shewanella algae]|uniref:ComEC/Rec2 family competence protein n=1 Tax=Shewanella algae TaxID=38313 RepID=UPI003AAA35CD
MYIDIIDAGHGDCILITCNETIVLVDSGPKSLKIRKGVIQQLTKLLGGRSVDIAVVTHNDDDHIGGFEYLIESGIKIKSFIFNSIEFLPKVFGKKSNTKKISFRQDTKLHGLLNEQNINVRTFQYEDAPIEFNGIKLTPLTPNEEILAKLNKEVVKRKIKKISGAKVKEQSIKNCLDDISSGGDIFTEDTSITNRSSISFILEFKDKRVVFLADSYASDVINAIKCKNIENIKFDAVKISHHASHKNTSSELIELLGKTEYIICADKSHHEHPNNKTISRIISYDNSSTFHLSSESQKLISTFNDCKKLGYDITTTNSQRGINRVCYE